MEVSRQEQGPVTVISLVGELDSGTAPGVHEDLRGLVFDRARVLLDMSGTSYMSSAGLRVLLLVHRDADQTGARIVLTGLSPEVGAVMAATGFLEYFAVADSVEVGLRELGG
jgi:anti-anti-sigma factor